MSTRMSPRLLWLLVTALVVGAAGLALQPHPWVRLARTLPAPRRQPTLADTAADREPIAEGARLAIAGERVHGSCVDASGSPVAGVGVQQLEGEYVWITHDTSSESGRFAVERRAEDLDHAWLRCVHDRFDVTFVRLAWGALDHTVVLRDLVPFEVEVVDQVGAPVAVARVAMMQPGPDGHDQDAKEQPFEPDGNRWRARLRRGVGELRVEPADATWAVPTPVFVTVADKAAMPLRVVLARNCERAVRVLAADGAPVAGAKIELVDPRGCELARYLKFDDDHWLAGPRRRAELQTDDRGEAILRGPAAPKLAIFVHRDGFTTRLVEDVELAVAEPLVVQLEVAASGRVRVLADPVLARWLDEGSCYALLEGARRTEVWPEPDRKHRGLPVARDGTVAFAGAPTGQWSVRLFGDLGAVENSGGALQLHAGDNGTIDIDLRSAVRVAVPLRLTLDGKPLAKTDFDVELPGQPWPIACWHAATDAAGRSTVWLCPGRYVVATRIAFEAAAELQGAVSTAFDVLADANTVVTDIAFASGEVQLTFVDGHGEPVPGLGALLTARSDDMPATWQGTDANGVLRLRRAAGGWQVLAGAAAMAAVPVPNPDFLAALRRSLRALARVDIRAGATTSATIVVPDDLLPDR